MKKTPKVVLLPSPENRVIASDDQSRRLVFSIGKPRVAFDFVTDLAPATGDRPGLCPSHQETFGATSEPASRTMFRVNLKKSLHRLGF
jgi:hypothetical protein